MDSRGEITKILMGNAPSKPKISVILATYNRVDLLPRAIAGILAQTFQDWELLIINDGSTDHTSAVIDSFIQKDSRIQGLSQKNQGLSASRARGVENAKAEYLAFLDDDDLYYPDKLQKQFEFMESHPEIDLVYSHVRVCGTGHGNKLPEIYPLETEAAVDFHGLLAACTIQVSSVLVRASAFRRWGNFRSDLRGHDDYEMWLRIALYGKINFQPWIVSQYWWHVSNMSHNNFRRIQSEYETYQSFLNKVSTAEDKKAIRREGSFKNYLRASDAMDRKEYKLAAQYYYYALTFDPFVGVTVPWNQAAGKIYRFLRPYLGLMLCFLRGLKSERK